MELGGFHEGFMEILMALSSPVATPQNPSQHVASARGDSELETEAKWIDHPSPGERSDMEQGLDVRAHM